MTRHTADRSIAALLLWGLGALGAGAVACKDPDAPSPPAAPGVAAPAPAAPKQPAQAAPKRRGDCGETAKAWAESLVGDGDQLVATGDIAGSAEGERGTWARVVLDQAPVLLVVGAAGACGQFEPEGLRTPWHKGERDPLCVTTQDRVGTRTRCCFGVRGGQPVVLSEYRSSKSKTLELDFARRKATLREPSGDPPQERFLVGAAPSGAPPTKVPLGRISLELSGRLEKGASLLKVGPRDVPLRIVAGPEEHRLPPSTEPTEVPAGGQPHLTIEGAGGTAQVQLHAGPLPPPMN